MDKFRIKNPLGTSPYLLVHGQEPLFPLHLWILVLKFMKRYAEDTDRVQIILVNLFELDEKRTTLEHIEKN